MKQLWMILVNGKPMRPSGEDQVAYMFETELEARRCVYNCYGNTRGIEIVHV